MFLIRPRFWVIVGFVLLGISALVFTYVSVQHKRSQDASRPPAEQQKLATNSEAAGYFGSFAAGFGLVSLVVAFVLWVLRSVLGLVF